MSIQRHAEDPGNALLGGETVKYRLSTTGKTTLRPKTTASVKPATPGRDIVYTLIVFAIGVAVIVLLSLRLR